MEALRLGALLPLSGPAAQWGIACLRGVELMVDKIDAEGGIQVDNKKHRIELVKTDNKSNIDTALNQANRLVFKEKVKYIFGCIISGCTLAVQGVTEPNKVMLFPWSDSPKVLGSDKNYTFRLHAYTLERILVAFNYLRENRPDIKTIGIIGPDDESG